MKTQGIRFIFKRRSLNKYLSPNVIKPLEEASREIYADAMKSQSGVRKVVIKGRGFKRDYGYGGVYVTVLKNKKYKLWPAKRARETMDNAYLGSGDEKGIKEAVIRLYNRCKNKLGLVDQQD